MPITDFMQYITPSLPAKDDHASAFVPTLSFVQGLAGIYLELGFEA
jgi:hypothetical protein